MDSYRSPPEHALSIPRQDGRWTGRGEDDQYLRRSPGPPDRRYRGRNRSRSPIAVDRYQSDSYHGGYSRDREGRRRPASPVPANIDRYVPGQDPRPLPTNPVPDPHQLDYQVGFSYFGEWWRHHEMVKEERERARNGGRRPPDRLRGEREGREDRAKEKARIQAAYDQYKETMQIKIARAFVQAHKGEEWFKERYVPALRDDIRTRLVEIRREAYATWEKEIDAGLFDEFTLEGIYKGDSNGLGGAVEKEEGEAVATAEVLGVGDLLPLRQGNIRDEAAFRPALLIKTIAPTVSRALLEAFCKEHLGERAGGLKWLSLSDPNPSKRFHRIGWVMLHPGGGGEHVMDDRADGRRVDQGDVEDDVTRPASDEDAAAGVADKALEAINGKTIHDEGRGDFTVHVGVHAPPTDPKKKALWDLFSVPERIDKDLQLARRLVSKLDEETASEFAAVARIEERVRRLRADGRLQAVAVAAAASSSSSSMTLSKESEGAQVQREADEGGEERVGEGKEDEEDDGAVVDDEVVDDEDLLATKKQLDILVEYLRRVHNFCFFCVFESDSVHELMRKCAGGHLRRPRASLSSMAKTAAKASVTGESFPAAFRPDAKDEGEGSGSSKAKGSRHASKNEQQLSRAFNWVKTYEEKILQMLEPEKVDLRKVGGKPMEEALDQELAKHVKQEDENKFRCKVSTCTKLFKAEHFWRKHVEKRHPEWYEGIKRDIDLMNNYVLDPSHIAPSRSDANSNGHFPSNNHHLTGTPRGFSLSSNPMGFSGVGLPGGSNGGGMFPPPGTTGFPPLFAPHAAQMAGTWGGPGTGDFGGMTTGAGGMGDERLVHPHHHGGGGGGGIPGPIRRGGGGMNHRPARMGPYDRRGRDGRDVRWNIGIGRLSPPRGGGMNMPGDGPGRSMGSGGGGGGPSPLGGFSHGRWGDGAGASAVGPREAVQGRSLKSYEDLDAVAGGGGGELNY